MAMNFSDAQLKELSDSSEAWLRGKIDDAEVAKTIEAIYSVGGADQTSLAVVGDQRITGVTGSVLCVIFYWRCTLDTPDGHSYTGNAGGIGSVGGGAIQGGLLVGSPDLNTLYAQATSFQFNSAAAALNINFFNSRSQFVGTFVGGGVGICLGTGGGSGSWSV
jgi:hypothetical protein